MIDFRHLRDLRWGNPKRTRVLIFDREGSEILAEEVLHGIDHTVLHVRKEFYWVSLKIFFWTLIYVARKRSLNSSWVANAYWCACIRVSQAEIVLTFIENSAHFQEFSNRLPYVHFAAIQNGTRCPADIARKDQLPEGVLPTAGRPGSRMNFDVFYTFGSWEQDLYTRYGHSVKKYVPLGSVRGALFERRMGATPSLQTAGICLISQWIADVGNDEFHADAGFGFSELTRAVGELVRKSFPVKVALRTNDPREKQSFRSLWGIEPEWVESDRPNFSSYRAAWASDLIISFNSTLAFELFGLGKKVLFCNFSGKSYLNFRAGEPFALNAIPSGAGFLETVERLLKLSAEEYSAMATESRKYYIRTLTESTPQNEIRREITERLNKRKGDVPFDAGEYSRA